ncbi:hypothetical protein CK203_035106 [Vitis vinifera]|uniref:Retrotransposon Copia-like N-terminal domain-containing protein n=1 Tax=Vitis vinifera TaxID=29760 RepID=A0A438I9N3_VITVI|nr:hypothetical protein CK203_035106 [Vitis vinifera]
MAMALTTKNKIGFVDGTIPRAAETDLLFNAWNRYNNMVTSWIINYVSKDIEDSLIKELLTLTHYYTKFKVLREETQEFSTITGLSLLKEPLHQGDVSSASVNAHTGDLASKEKRSDLNVAIVDCKVIPLIVVTNCMDTH